MYNLYTHLCPEQTYKVHKDSMIVHEGKRYSVTKKYIGLKVTASEVDDDNLCIYYNNDCIACHPISRKITHFSMPLKSLLLMYLKKCPILKQKKRGAIVQYAGKIQLTVKEIEGYVMSCCIEWVCCKWFHFHFQMIFRQIHSAFYEHLRKYVSEIHTNSCYRNDYSLL
jgi:hypothetical protein